MPTVAAIRALQDANVEIPDSSSGVNDRHFQFDLPDYAPRQSVLMFRLRAVQDSTFQFRIQGTDALTHVLERDATRTFHEIYPGESLKESGNELILFVGAGRVVVSDIVILYQVEAASKGPFADSVVNVRDFGANGNGITYDTDAVKSAIEASQEGDAVYFPAGTYVLSESLRPKARQLYFSLTGATLRARPAEGERGFPVFNVQSCPVEFRNLAIDGGKDKRSKPANPATAPGIWVRPDRGAMQVSVSGCRIRNTHGDGIRIMGGPDADRESDRVTVRDTTVQDCGWKGIGNGLTLGRVDNVRVESCWFESCHNGIKMLDCHDVLVRSVTALANRRHGIAFTFSHRWHVDNCVARSNGTGADVAKEPGGWGIAAGGEPIKNLTPNSVFTITNNTCEDNAEGGITLDPTAADDPTTDQDESAQVFPQRARVSGNVCRGLRKDDSALWVEDATGSHGIHVRNSSAVVVTDNICHHNNRSGIAVVNSSHVLVQANACYHNLHGIGLFSREGIENPGGHTIGVNMLYDNKGEDLEQGGSQVPLTSLPGVRLYGLHGSEEPNLPANPGTLYERHEDGQGALYVKQAGNDTTGWVRLT